MNEKSATAALNERECAAGQRKAAHKGARHTDATYGRKVLASQAVSNRNSARAPVGDDRRVLGFP